MKTKDKPLAFNLKIKHQQLALDIHKEGIAKCKRNIEPALSWFGQWTLKLSRLICVWPEAHILNY